MSYKMIDIYNTNTFIHTPNIDRIGNEGAILKYYSTNALCIPGRTSLLTGNYGHKTGAINNSAYPSQSLQTIPKILNANGYYTALCGKWMLGTPFPKPEFDYWLWTPNSTTYYNDSARYYDSLISVTGHMTDFITDSALQLISRIDTPFFMMLSYNAPHTPHVPELQYTNYYAADSFSIPLNWNAYTANYPSFLYAPGSHPITTLPEYENENRDYYAMMLGIESATGKILDSLQANGLLENTMVIFTTDNSYLLGEHRLRGKSLPYDECMKMPMLIRYPAWFQPGTVIDSSITLNIDVAPSVLDAVGIVDTFNMDGTSIHSITSNQFKRKEFLYEQTPEPIDSIASVRTFKDNYFQYNRYYCSDTTEELFDMIQDPYQKKNLVHHYFYQDTLTQYRLKLDSIRLALNDTSVLNSENCYLFNPVYTYMSPSVSISKINTTCDSLNGSIDVTLLTGTPPFIFQWNNGATTEDLYNIASGVYHVTVTDINANTVSQGINISNLNGPTLYETHINATYNNADGNINLFVSGPSNPFVYEWNNGATTQDLHLIPAGFYSVTVTDSIGCVALLNVVIASNEINDPHDSEIDSVGHTSSVQVEELKNIIGEIELFPDPASEFISIAATNLEGIWTVEWYNGMGIKIGKTEMHFIAGNKNKIDLSAFNSGLYFIRISNGKNEFLKPFTIVK